MADGVIDDDEVGLYVDVGVYVDDSVTLADTVRVLVRDADADAVPDAVYVAEGVYDAVDVLE